MKGRQIFLDHLGKREIAALTVDGRLEDLLVSDPDRPAPGAIFRGIVQRPVKGIGGVFLDLGDGATGFLRGAKGLRDGGALLVQVTGRAEPAKAIPVGARLLFKSRYCIVTPGALGINISRKIADDAERERLMEIAVDQSLPDGAGMILRSGAESVDADAIMDDIAQMSALAGAVLGDAGGREPEALTEGDGPHVLAWREWGEAGVQTEPGNLAQSGVLDLIAAAVGPDHDVGTARLRLEPTRACVAVDVDTGRDFSPAAGLKANLAAAADLPRALRLRGLAGQIVVDFAPVPKAQRRQVDQALRAAFRRDPIETSLVGWTQMGLFELNRKRERAPVAPLLAGLL